jgi:hypothetical protein
VYFEDVKYLLKYELFFEELVTFMYMDSFTSYRGKN